MPDLNWTHIIALVSGIAIGRYFMSPRKSRGYARRLKKEKLAVAIEETGLAPGAEVKLETPSLPVQSQGEQELVPGVEAKQDSASPPVLHQEDPVPVVAEKERKQAEIERIRLASELVAVNVQLNKGLAEREKYRREVEKLASEIRQLRATAQQAEIEQKARAKASLSVPMDAPDFPLPQIKLIPGSTGGVWRSACGSVHGCEKTNEQCQDRSCLLITKGGKIAVLVVADGAGSAANSAVGAEASVKAISEFAKAELELFEAKNESINQEMFRRLSASAFVAALKAVTLRAEADKQALQSYGATLIMVVVGPDFTACAHIGDGRAGCCLRDGQWVPLLTPMKGGEANMTRFLTHLRDDPELVQVNFIPMPSSAAFCISDGCENASWFTKTKPQYRNNGALVDPNVPSAEFWGSIAKTVAELPDKFRAQGMLDTDIQANMDKLFAQFLLVGNPTLQSERDDKTIALAVNLP